MRSYLAVIFISCCLVMPACGDNDDEPLGDAGLDQGLLDGFTVSEGGQDGPIQKDAPQPDGAQADTVPSEGGVEEAAPDGPAPDATPADGPMPADGPVTEAMPADGPPSDAIVADGPVPGDALPEDGPMTDAISTDGPPPGDGLPADGPPPGDVLPADGPPPGDGLPADGTIVDLPVPDTMVDLPLLDTTLDLPPLDTTVDLPPDTTVDLPPDTTVDLPLDTTVDLPPGDTTNDTVAYNEAGQIMECQGPLGPMVCQCNDGDDNDADGKIDYPNDPDCLSLVDNAEIGGDTECSDSIDNDGDGLIDSLDPECTGMIDDDESGFGTAIPGDNSDCKEDCFFDGDSGGGSIKCEWKIQCDPLNPGPIAHDKTSCAYDPSIADDPECDPDYPQPQSCLDWCLPITPNGCDCFGCCQVIVGGVTKIIKLNDHCTEETFNDPLSCPPCTQVTSCLNECGPCEICIGKPAPDPSCFPTDDAGVPIDGGVPSMCDPGVIECPTGVECPPGYWCSDGCCVEWPS